MQGIVRNNPCLLRSTSSIPGLGQRPPLGQGGFKVALPGRRGAGLKVLGKQRARRRQSHEYQLDGQYDGQGHGPWKAVRGCRRGAHRRSLQMSSEFAHSDLKANQSAPDAEPNRLRTIGSAELRQQSTHVEFHGALCDGQLPRDFLVPFTISEQLENGLLAPREQGGGDVRLVLQCASMVRHGRSVFQSGGACCSDDADGWQQVSGFGGPFTSAIGSVSIRCKGAALNCTLDQVGGRVFKSWQGIS